MSRCEVVTDDEGYSRCLTCQAMWAPYDDDEDDEQPAPDTTHPQPDRPGTESKEQGR